MSDVKELQVTLTTDAEAAALTGGKKPRRQRSTRKQRGGGGAVPAGEIPDGTGGALSPQEAAVAEGPEARVLKLDTSTPATPPTGILEPVSGEGSGAPILAAPKPMSGGGVTTQEPISPLATALSITPPAVTLPSLATTTIGGAQPVGLKIGGKRGVSTVNTVPVAKILPTKRRVSAAPPAQTLKKPKFKVSGGGIMTSEIPGVRDTVTGADSATGGTKAGGAAKQTRRFKERKIKLTVKSSRTAREIRHKVKAQVRGMPIADVRKLLLKKNIIKTSAAEKLPEEMLRNMLRDYMMLHNVE
jgi:hypothetical protein